MNLNTHVATALFVGTILFHEPSLAVLVGIGAVLPDLDREYIFTKRRTFARLQVHRALLHNLFFSLLMLKFNLYLGLGILVHIALDMLTSPTDRGVELFFPLGRFVRRYRLSYRGGIKEQGGGLMWYLEDPLPLIRSTADPGLKEERGFPWLRVYGPFKNSMIVDWGIFYASIIFLVLNMGVLGFLSWFIKVLLIAFTKYTAISVGTVLFYGVGEIWRRKLQFTRISGLTRAILAGIMASGAVLMVYGIQSLKVGTYFPFPVEYLELLIISIVIGFTLAVIHVKLRKGTLIL